jgi:hypothetical protein
MSTHLADHQRIERLQAELDAAVNELRPLRAQRDALIDAAIVETGAVFVWHLGSKGGHEPTRELARSSVRRAAELEKPS